MNTYGQTWEPSEFDGVPAQPERGYIEKPERWYRENAAVFHALEEWTRAWEEHAEQYERQHGRRPSSMNRDKNKSAFRRKLIEAYGRGEPDAQWLAERVSFFERRGRSTDRAEGRFG